MRCISRENKVATVLIIILPILTSYQSPVAALGIGELVLLVAGIISLPYMLKNNNITIYKYYYFIFYSILISLFVLLIHNTYNLSDIIKRLGVMIFYTFIIFGFADKLFNIDYGLKLYKKLALFSAGFIFIQTGFYYFFNKVILGILPGTTLNYSISSYSGLYQKYAGMSDILFRPASFFLEPSYFAQFIAPSLLLILFTEHTKSTYPKAIFITVSMLLSTSANAFAFAGVIWILYLEIYARHNNGISKMIKIFSVSVLLFVIIYYVFTKIPALLSVIERFNLIGNGSSGSANVRTMKGLMFFNEINIFEKIFGVGFGTYYSYIQNNPVNIPDVQDEYMSSLGYLLTSTGLFGFSLFLISLKDMVKSYSKSAKALVLLLFVYSLSSSVFSSPVYVLIITFVLKLKKENDKFQY